MTLQVQIRIYYFTKDNKVQEVGYTNGAWGVGPTLGEVDPSSTGLYASVRTSGSDLAEIRVGYQSKSKPQTITESFFTQSENKWAVREYPDVM